MALDRSHYERWTATPLYKLWLPAGQRAKLPIDVVLTRGMPDDDVSYEEVWKFQKAEAQKEEIRIAEAYDANGASLTRVMQLSLNTMTSEDGYWLDNGSYRLNEPDKMDQAQIKQSCLGASAAIADGLEWIGDDRSAKKVGHDHPRLERILRRNSREANRLLYTLERPTCIGVFGPSQAGKSYLISVLARKDGVERLIAKFDGQKPEVDFIKDINPLGGQEATGLVTRFTMASQSSPEGYPVCLRLLSQTDIVKILLNSYYQDGDQDYDSDIDCEAIDNHLAPYEKRPAEQPPGAFDEADIWDIQEYVAKNSGGAASAKAFERAWDRIARIAPCLKANEKDAFLSILWGKHEVYTQIFDQLVSALALMNYESDAFCTLDSLMPSTEGILNVDTLGGILQTDAKTVQIRTRLGSPITLLKPVVTALAMELRIVCRDEPQPFMRHTDLLDFPGYRSRETTHIEKAYRDAPDRLAKNLFLRGKVDYLFQFYTAYLELASLVLCLADSNLEVTTLPKAIESWVSVTHGATPEKRIGKPSLLFFTLTKFDRHLTESAGEEGNHPALRFETRLKASLLDPFGKTETSWPRQWTPAAPFKNVFCIRNPNIKSEHVIKYSGWNEIELIPERQERIRQLREAFIESQIVRSHFYDPANSWDEVMKLNDGGVSHLAKALGVVATPDLKLKQIAGRLTEVRIEAAEALRAHYVPSNNEERLRERLAIVEEKIFADFDTCAENLTFGSALRGMMVDASDLYAALSDALRRPSTAEPRKEGKRAGIFSAIRSGGTTPVQVADKWSRIAAAALTCWTNLMFSRAEDPVFSRRVGISQETLKEMVAEFSNGARSAGIADRIANYIREAAEETQSPESFARKASLVAERSINRYVAQLDLDNKSPEVQRNQYGEYLPEAVFIPEKVKIDIADLPSEPRDFTTEFMIDWGKAFRATVAQNAIFGEGLIDDPQHNARLGKILTAIAA